MPNRDERPLAELRFANHILDEAERTQVEAQVRELLQDTVEVAQNLIDQGCVGLYDHFAETVGMNAAALKTVRFILTNIGGSGTGLPCHVPPDKFCLIHNCVGTMLGHGPFLARPGMTRDLTEEEKKNSLAVRIFTEQQAAKELKTHFQAEDADTEAMLADPVGITGKAVDQFHLQNVQGTLICGEHKIPNFACKYCVAQAILAKPENGLRAKPFDTADGRTEQYYLVFNTRVEFLK